MYNIKINNKKAFAVRFKNSISNNMLSLLELTENLANTYSEFKVEGVNKKLKTNFTPKITKTLTVELGGVNFEMGGGKFVRRNLLGVGCTGDVDVAYVANKDIKVGKYLNIVPIYDVDKDYDLILKALDEYIKEEYKAKVKTKKKKAKKDNTVEFTNYVRFGNSYLKRSDLSDLGTLVTGKSPAKKKKKNKKEVRFTFPLLNL